MKRSFDIIFSVLSIVILIPFFVIIIIFIKLSDKGPVFFCQKRVGKNGRPFKMYKFRTMRNSESKILSGFEPGDVSRVTVIGKFLRKTKIDELPQLINVMKGEMSFVGPRPEVEKYVDLYPERWAKVLKVKPGITDNASLIFRDEEGLLSKSKEPELTYEEIILPRKLKIYEDYARNNSFFGDLQIIFKTIVSVIFR